MGIIPNPILISLFLILYHLVLLPIQLICLIQLRAVDLCLKNESRDLHPYVMYYALYKC